MLEVSQAQLRRFRNVLKKSVQTNGSRHLPAFVVFRGSANGLTIESQSTTAAIQLHVPGAFASESLTLPANALVELEGKPDQLVQLEATADGVAVSWHDGVVPQNRHYEAVEPKSVPLMPAVPTAMSQLPERLLTALHTAYKMTSPDNLKYALETILLDGPRSRLVATDGRQLLVESGFTFPWKDELRVWRSQVFACKELRGHDTMAFGRSDHWVTFQIDAWTIHLAIEKDGRYPPVDSLIPHDKEPLTTVCLSDEDAQFLEKAVEHLPGRTDENAPVTVDANGKLCVRAKGQDQKSVTEIELSRSRSSGQPLRWATNREYLARAIRLGFTEVNVFDPERPVVCRQPDRLYMWQPLSKATTIAADPHATRIVSDSAGPPTSHTHHSRKETTMPVTPPKTHSAAAQVSNNGNGNGHASTSDLITEIEALRGVLRDAFTRTTQLAAAVKRQQKNTRLLRTTLASLKQLQQVEAEV